MNLLRSICCLFGRRCAPEEGKSAGDTMRAEQSVQPTSAKRKLI